ncbi:hypothetical protein WI372_17200 [Gemmatimonadota bacterium DH-20]|uniref:Uncharacterized protein n=1 Tax=Gaopeijia maritima TaxID=3119007 RepID=A0ABU9EDA8_9BACT
MDLDQVLLIEQERLKRAIVRVLERAPNRSHLKKTLVRSICQELSISHLRGTRRDRFQKMVNRAVGDLKRTKPPRIKEYKATNVRLKLLD